MINISVIGAGTMGSGIAHEFARYDYRITLIDTEEKALKNAMDTISKNLDRQIRKGSIDGKQKEKTLQNISISGKLKGSVETAGLVIEAISENFEVKKELFTELDSLTGPDVILASNTSSISITSLGSVTRKPEKIIGMHFMNPVPVMELVEIIRGFKTSGTTAAIINELTRSIGKVPVEVRDFPGFISNRILMPMINEAVFTLFEGVAGVDEIDTVMRLGMAHPMGPLELADFIGLDVCLAILDVLYKGTGNPKYAPCPLLVKLVNAGHLGIKSKTGFYTWPASGRKGRKAVRFN